MSSMKKEMRNDFGKLYLIIEYDSENNWVLNTWIGYQTIENVVKGADACLEVLKQNNCSFLLNNNLQVVGTWDLATNWIAQDWAPRAVSVGLTHFAQVVSPETFAALSSDMMNSKISNFFSMKVFDNRQAAEEWLRSASGNNA